MLFHIAEVSERNELNDVVDVLWAAMDGVHPHHSIFFPTLVSGRSAAVAESKERLWNEHMRNPASHFIYAREGPVGSRTGAIIGGCQWRFYEKNPFPFNKPEIVATWWPDGVGRLFATEVVRQCYTPRPVWMARPHSGLSFMCVRPDLQGRGIGTRLVAWGVDQSDQRGLESFIEGTGEGVYQKCGYTPVQKVAVTLEECIVGQDNEWKELQRKMLPIRYTALWRPKGGIYEEGEPERTWDKRLGLTYTT